MNQHKPLHLYTELDKLHIQTEYEKYCNRIGRKMIYKPTHAKNDPSQWEYGHLSSVRLNEETGEILIWVRFKGPNGERCNLEDISNDM